MILAIDVGNSSISLGAFNTEGRLEFVSGFETELGRSRDRCAIAVSYTHLDVYKRQAMAKPVGYIGGIPNRR